MLKKVVILGTIILIVSLGHLSITRVLMAHEYIFYNDQCASVIIPIDGSILYVGGSGPENYSRIQDAINDATDGDTVFVYNDSSPYYENIIINKSISVIGENQESTIIDGNGQGDVVKIAADNIIIKNFTIQNSGVHGYVTAGILCESAYVVIDNNTVINNDNGIFSVSSSFNCSILRNKIEYNFEGIYLISDCNVIKENLITNNSWDGIGLQFSNYNIISKNVIIKNKANGIYLHSRSNNNFISNNNILNNDCGIFLFWNCSYNNISNNFINNSIKFDGIIISISSENIIYSNTIVNNSIEGITIHRSINNKIILNNFNKNKIGIILKNSTMNEIFNNNFQSNTINPPSALRS